MKNDSSTNDLEEMKVGDFADSGYFFSGIKKYCSWPLVHRPGTSDLELLKTKVHKSILDIEKEYTQRNNHRGNYLLSKGQSHSQFVDQAKQSALEYLKSCQNTDADIAHQVAISASNIQAPSRAPASVGPAILRKK